MRCREISVCVPLISQTPYEQALSRRDLSIALMCQSRANRRRYFFHCTRNLELTMSRSASRFLLTLEAISSRLELRFEQGLQTQKRTGLFWCSVMGIIPKPRAFCLRGEESWRGLIQAKPILETVSPSPKGERSEEHDCTMANLSHTLSHQSQTIDRAARLHRHFRSGAAWWAG
jgi:hypothetical protein